MGSCSGHPQPLTALRHKPSEARNSGGVIVTLTSASSRAGAGLDGVEEIKRHPFFVTIDWNVSARGGPHLSWTTGSEVEGTPAGYEPEVNAALSPRGSGIFHSSPQQPAPNPCTTRPFRGRFR